MRMIDSSQDQADVMLIDISCSYPLTAHLLWVFESGRSQVSYETHGLQGSGVEVRWFTVHHLYNHHP